jgi:UbiA prenyltransferase family
MNMPPQPTVLGEHPAVSIAARQPIRFATLLKLGRVSNMPTIWSNVLAGTVIAEGDWQGVRIGIVLLAMSLFHLGGMYLNDYFDRDIDARERSERPIPSADIGAQTVAAIGFGMLGVAAVLLSCLGMPAASVALILLIAIVGYDVFHKGNPAAPWVMGLCRTLVYWGAAAAIVGRISVAVGLAGLAMLCYVAGLTYAARQESLDRVGNLWPLLILAAPMVLATPALGQGPLAIAIYLALIGWTVHAIYLLAKRPMPGAVSRAVALLLAGISLVDAAFLASVGQTVPALLAVVAFGATLTLQRFVAAT